MIISASRRTDIPSYYSEWLVNRLREGYVLTRNPMNHSQISRIRLSPDIIDCIVFWTKDPANMMDKLKIIDEMGYKYYFQFTLTPYGKAIERGLRDKDEIINTFIKLSHNIGKDKVLWRYDPIILNDTFSTQYHSRSFEALCKRLRGYTDICTISFADMYTKLSAAVKANILREITKPEMAALSGTISEIGKACGIEVRSCCEARELSAYGVKPASCIDRRVIERVCGCTICADRDKNQRAGCNCIQSIDIGAYNTCRNGCVYCYANYSDKAVINNCNKHDPKSDILIGTVSQEENISERKMKTLKH